MSLWAVDNASLAETTAARAAALHFHRPAVMDHRNVGDNWSGNRRRQLRHYTPLDAWFDLDSRWPKSGEVAFRIVVSLVQTGNVDPGNLG